MAVKGAANGFSEKFKNFMEMPPGIIGREVRIELRGSREALIDGCTGIREYDENIIRLSGGANDVRITGKNLVINSLTTDQLMIEGFIITVEFV